MQAMASVGIIPGILACLFSGAVAALGLFFLSKCAAKAPHRRASFFAVSQMTFPKAAVFFDAAVAIKCFGVSIRCAFDPRCLFHQVISELKERFYYSYLIILKTLMPSVVKALYHVLVPDDPPDWALSGRIWICIFMVPLAPLCFLRSLHSLRHTSYIALFAVGMLHLVLMPKG
jgi:amino acid permease